MSSPIPDQYLVTLNKLRYRTTSSYPLRGKFMMMFPSNRAFTVHDLLPDVTSYTWVPSHCPLFLKSIGCPEERECVALIFPVVDPLSCSLVSWGRELTSKLACVLPIYCKTLCVMSLHKVSQCFLHSRNLNIILTKIN